MQSVTNTEIEIPLPSGESMPALLVEPDVSGPRPAVMVAGDIGGARRPFIDMIANRLGEAGYDAIVPEFFFRQGPLEEMVPEKVLERRATLDDLQVLADLQAAIDWLRDRPSFAGSEVGTVGFCLGGTFVLNLAALRDDLATVAYYGFPGETPAKAGVQGPYPRDEVEALNGPLLAFWGDSDMRAGPDNVRAYVAAVGERDADLEVVVYPGLDHGFLTTSWDPGTEGHDLALDSWARTLSFFEQHLTSGAGASARPASPGEADS